MTSPSAPKDKFLEKVINPYLKEVLRHPQAIEMREGVLHIRDVEGPKETGSMEKRLETKIGDFCVIRESKPPGDYIMNFYRPKYMSCTKTESAEHTRCPRGRGACPVG